MQDYEQAAETLAKAIEGFELRADPITERKRNDQWSRAVHFRVALTAPNGATWDGEYSAGSAHPLTDAADAAKAGENAWRDWLTQARKRGASFGAYGVGSPRRDDVCRLAGKFGQGRTIHEAELESQLRKAYRPSALDLVGCLFADASGVSELTFREWCDDYGYGPDNPADTLDAFDACKRAALFLRRAFGDRFESLAEVAGEL